MKLIILLIAVAFAGCNSVHSNSNIDRALAGASPSPQSNNTYQSPSIIRRVTTAELDELMKQGKVVVVDVRSQDAYDKGHIRGAKLIPLNQVGERAKELPRDKTIVTYCG